MNAALRRAAFLIPVYQDQQNFDDTMRSIASSTVPCSVIAVDDGSEPPLHAGDYGSAIALHLIRLPHNQGIVAAMNAGLEFAIQAGYEFVARIDAGDYVSPERLERQIQYMDTHPNCMVVGSDAEFRFETGIYCFTVEPPRNPAALSRAMHQRAWLLHPSVMYRTVVLSDVGFYTNEYPAAEDYEMFLRIAQRHEVGVVPEPLIVYIIRRSGISLRRVHMQAWSRLRIQLHYFAWRNWHSYYGVARTIATLLLPYAVKISLKSRFVYRRTVQRKTQPSSSSPVPAVVPSTPGRISQ
jgi:glycosyltransferase involved in cell wall biosynthesis